MTSTITKIVGRLIILGAAPGETIETDLEDLETREAKTHTKTLLGPQENKFMSHQMS